MPNRRSFNAALLMLPLAVALPLPALAAKPVKGSPEFATQWKGATWEFSSAENLEKFKANPQAFAPQYGGHCAYGVTKGSLVNGEPEQWSIIDGKLYLNYSAGVQKTWSKDTAGNISKADGNWPGLVN